MIACVSMAVSKRSGTAGFSPTIFLWTQLAHVPFEVVNTHRVEVLLVFTTSSISQAIPEKLCSIVQISFPNWQKATLRQNLHCTYLRSNFQAFNGGGEGGGLATRSPELCLPSQDFGHTFNEMVLRALQMHYKCIIRAIRIEYVLQAGKTLVICSQFECG